VRRGAKQLSCLTTELVEVGSVGKLRHDVSSPPGLAFGREVKTILPESTTLPEAAEVDSGPAREPGGALLRRCRQLTPRSSRLPAERHNVRSSRV
jgi:hypothetical protein